MKTSAFILRVDQASLHTGILWHLHLLSVYLTIKRDRRYSVFGGIAGRRKFDRTRPARIGGNRKNARYARY